MKAVSVKSKKWGTEEEAKKELLEIAKKYPESEGWEKDCEYIESRKLTPSASVLESDKYEYRACRLQHKE